MENLENLFKEFRFDTEKKEVYEKLRKEVDPEISKTLLAVIVSQKKTYEKCLKSCENMSEMVKKNNFSKIRLNKKQYASLMKDIFIFDEGIRSSDGKNVYLSKPPLLMRESSLTFDEKIGVFLWGMNLVLSNYPEVSRDGLVLSLNLEDSSVRYFDVNLIKTLHGMIKKLPFRPTRILVFNAPWFFRVVFGIIKPFMAGKIVKRVEVVDVKTLKENISEELLPPAFKGRRKHRMADTVRKYLIREGDDEGLKIFTKICEKNDWEFEEKYELKKEEEEEEGESEEEEEEGEESEESNDDDEEEESSDEND